MPPPVPPELTDNQEAELWWDIARLFEDYHPDWGYDGDKKGFYPQAGSKERIASFLKVCDLITNDLRPLLEKEVVAA